MGLMMARLLVMARILSIEEYGLYSLGLLVSGSFSMLSCLGLQLVLQRDSPYFLAKGLERRAAILTIQACIIALLLLLIFLIVALFSALYYRIETIVFIGLLHGFSQQIFIISTVDNRSRGNVLQYSKNNLWRAFFVLGVSCIIGLTCNSSGIILLADAVLTIFFSYIFFKSSYKNNAYIKACIRAGFNSLKGVKWSVCSIFFINSLIGFSLLNADRWTASILLTVDNFSIYSFAGIIFVFGTSAHALINTSIFPYLSKKNTHLGSKAIFVEVLKLTVILLIGYSLVSIPFLLMRKEIIEDYFNKYQIVIDVIPIFILISIIRASDFWFTYLMIIGKESTIFYISFITALLSIGSYYIIFKFNYFYASIYTISIVNLVITILIFIFGGIFSWKHRNCLKN